MSLRSMNLGSNMDKMSMISESQAGGVAVHNMAVHQGVVVMLELIHVNPIQLSREDHLELNAVRNASKNLRHCFEYEIILSPGRSPKSWKSDKSVQIISLAWELMLDYVLSLLSKVHVIANRQSARWADLMS